jgi:hypothetical protein
MRTGSILLALAAAVGVAITAVDAATAQGTPDRMGPGMMQGGTDRETMGQDGMGQKMMQGDMGHCMMRGGIGSEMGSQMGHGMMMGRGMMQGGASSGMDALFGSRVRPVTNLSVDDVRGYLALRLERLDNKRLKVGDIKTDEKTITADIVTVDNSLVQQLKVDRHTGAIEYQN